jgi:alpha-ketoglutarate-dependent taurine dioxygenase
MEAPGLGKTFAFQPGQIQVINNRRIGHRRTPFRDASEPEKRRHLIRLWLRDEGDRSFLG